MRTKHVAESRLSATGHTLLEPDSIALLTRRGVPFSPHRVVADVEEAVAAADHLGYPVVIKVVSPQAVHKSDVGGVVIGINDEAALRGAIVQVTDSVLSHSNSAVIQGYMVAKHQPDGLEMIVGALRDVDCGPAVVCGAGGTQVEIMDDVSFGLAPLTLTEAEKLIAALRVYPLLREFRGRPAGDIAGLAKLLVDLSELVVEDPSILEVDLNPVRVYASSVVALDARVVIEMDPLLPLCDAPRGEAPAMNIGGRATQTRRGEHR